MNTIVLLACSKRKLPVSAIASDLYQGNLFRLAKQLYSRCMYLPYYILSAKHGLVTPTQMLDPYDQTLYKMPAEQRQAWYAMVNEQMREARLFDKRYTWYVACAPMYYTGLDPFLRGKMYYPLRGLGYGQQCAKLRRLIDGTCTKADHDDEWRIVL